MIARALVRELEDAGAILEVRHGKLRVDAPKGLVTVEMRERLVRRKEEILRLLDGVLTEPPTAEYPPVAVDDDGLPCASCRWCGGRVFWIPRPPDQRWRCPECEPVRDDSHAWCALPPAKRRP